MEEPPRKRRNREHTNSRNGCVQCKARKVKCDEEKPKCRACNRRNTPCTYTNHGLNRLASAASAASSPYNTSDGSSFTPIHQDHRNNASRNHQTHSNTPNRNHVIQTTSPSPIPAPPALSLNMAHLELMHHFVAVTARDISICRSSHEVWHMTVPQIALAHEFLMHAILATSALHIAHLRPEKRQGYWKRAAIHQDRALQLQQVAMAHPTKENADALFAFSLLIMYLASAAPSTARGPTDETALDAAISSIHMLRGVRLILPAIKHWVEQGPLAQILSWYPGHIQSKPTFRDPSTEEHFSKLLVFCSTTPTLDQDTEMEDVECYAAAASSLRASFLKVESAHEDDPNTPPIWHWAIRLPTTFMERLREHHVVPLVLLAHWCVILLQARHYWWVGSWVARTMGEIAGSLPQEYKTWLEWPTEKILEVRETLSCSQEQRI